MIHLRRFGVPTSWSSLSDLRKQTPNNATVPSPGALSERTTSSSSAGSGSIDRNSAQPSCFEADPNRVSVYLTSNITFSKPVLNLGMPKVGSTSLMQFFRCSGWKASHWATIRHGILGACFQKAVNKGQPLLQSCDSWYHPKYYQEKPKNGDNRTEAVLQLDYTLVNGTCRFPQVQDLDKLHQEAPNATFVLMFRPINDWFVSMRDWRPPNPLMKVNGTYLSFLDRMVDCDLPGLPAGYGSSLEEMQQFWCGHVRRVRALVDKYPSHKLVELNLYDTQKNAEIMAQLFHSRSLCWKQANANKAGHG